MRTIYIDSEFKCHVTDDGTRKAVETAFFGGKCDAFVEGYCYDDRNGYVQIYPWKPYKELDNAQREFERQMLEEYEEELAELHENCISIAELNEAYRKGVDSAYD